MRFIGVDLAWTPNGGTGLCSVSDGRVDGSTRLISDDDMLEWLEERTREDVLVAIDAPLIVRNVAGRRPVEKIISRCFGSRHASAHSSNLSLASFRNGVRGEWLASALRLDIEPEFPPRTPVRRAIEVYPHTALVGLFDLPTTLKYKGKAGRTLAVRLSEFARLLALLESLRGWDPALQVSALPRWNELKAAVALPATAASLARIEDEVDAYVCAYTAFYYWWHGTAKSHVVGDTATGYIVTPVTRELDQCLDRVSAELAAL